MRKYPRIDSVQEIEGPSKLRPRCQACNRSAMFRVTIQNSQYRRKDVTILRCELHVPATKGGAA